MAVSLNSVIGFNPVQVSRSSVGSTATKATHVSSTQVLINSSRAIKCGGRRSSLLVAKSENIITDNGESSKNADFLASQDTVPASSQSERSVASNSKPPASEGSIGSNPTTDAQSTLKKAPLTARERLRAARVLSRDSESKPAKPEKRRSVLDALRESEKGKKGLPQAPTNLFDDSKRGMPKAGLTFSFPGGNDLFVIVFSFVFISTVMFATTYFVWKVGAIHFNDN